MPLKPKGQLLISACLLGEPVRYDGMAKQLNDPRIDHWNQQGRLIAVCPETLGGLSTPRQPAEIIGGDGSAVLRGIAKVITIGQNNVSKAFIDGAERVAALIEEQAIIAALLKRYSPSCGNDQIYDGSFSHQLAVGSGVTAHLLSTHGIPIFNETQLDALARLIQEIDSTCPE